MAWQSKFATKAIMVAGRAAVRRSFERSKPRNQARLERSGESARFALGVVVRAVIGCFLRNCNVMWMVLSDSCR